MGLNVNGHKTTNNELYNIDNLQRDDELPDTALFMYFRTLMIHNNENPSQTKTITAWHRLYNGCQETVNRKLTISFITEALTER